MAYSEDYRKRTVEYYREGHTKAQVQEAFKIYPSTLRDWEARYDAGDLTPHYPKTRQSRKVPPDELKSYVDEHSDDFQREIGDHFGCSQPAISKALAKLDYTCKIKKKKNAMPNALKKPAKNTNK